MKTKFTILLLLFCFITSNAKLTSFKNEVKGTYNYWFYEPKEILIKRDSLKIKNDYIEAINDIFSVTTNKIAAINYNILKEAEKALNNKNNTGFTVEQVRALNDSVYVKKQPLIIFLHGRSLCGRNLQRVLRYGTLDAQIKGRNVGGYILAPQNPGEAWNPKKIMKIVDWAVQKYDIDTTRIYVLGMSLGGFGTMDLAAAYPDRIAAAMALCGGATSKTLGNLNKVPLWIIHGTADRAVSVKESRKVMEEMKKHGETERLIYDEWKGASHGRLARVLYLPETYEWLNKHSLTDKSRPVNKEIVINLESLRKAYRNMNHKARYNTFEK